MSLWRCERCGYLNTSHLRSRHERRVCEECETPRGWAYDGPEDVGDTTGDGPAVRAEMADRLPELQERSADLWAALHGFRESRGARCPRRLVGERCGLRYGMGDEEDCECRQPWVDHASLWLDEAGKPRAWVVQPYHLNETSMRAISDLCERLGLRVWCNGSDSWHFPGHTIALVFERVDAEARQGRRLGTCSRGGGDGESNS